MPKYETLDKLFHKDNSSKRFENNEELYRKRITSESTFRTGINLKHGELFFIVPKELTILQEEVLRVERKVSAAWKALPGIAQFAYIRSLILDEIIETNEMEGIRSTRKQVMKAIDIAEKENKGQKKEQFVEFANLYLELNNPELPAPQTPEEIRKIYDAVVEDVVDDANSPDGKLFRKSGVEIETRSGNVIHRGVDPEEKIIEMLQSMIRIAESDEYPALFSSAISHFLFEYIHPFYDGNGRTGRYLLAKYLAAPLSLPTVLSLSKTIAENKEKYYKAFEITEKELNHSEATYFVMELIKLVKSAQLDLLMSLEDKQRLLQNADTLLNEIGKDYELSEFEYQVMYGAIQACLFGIQRGIDLEDISKLTSRSKQSSRIYASKLEKKGLLVKYRNRPVMFALTDKAESLLGLASSEKA